MSDQERHQQPRGHGPADRPSGPWVRLRGRGPLRRGPRLCRGAGELQDLLELRPSRGVLGLQGVGFGMAIFRVLWFTQEGCGSA